MYYDSNMPSKQAARIILMSVCLTLLVGFSFLPRWPLLLQAAGATLAIAAFPLLGSLGVFKSLGIGHIPGSQWRPRFMFAAIGLMPVAFV